MPALGRMNGKDFALCEKHVCVKKVCCHPPHKSQGPAVKAAKRTKVNGKPALRVGDQGVHDKGTCCGPNKWIAMKCVEDRKVFIEGMPAFCVGDISLHCERDQGKLMKGSENVFVKGKASAK